MVSDGFAVTSGAYLSAAAIFSNNPTVTTVKIGRRALAFTQISKLTCLSAVTGDVYSFKVGSSTISYTVPGASTTSTVATALAALITTAAPAGMASCAAAVAVITITATAGALVDITFDNAHTTFQDFTTDPGIATDLSAILAADANWYGLLLDSEGDAEVTAAAAWTESNKKLFVFNSSDSNIATSAVNDLFSTLKTSSYARTVPLFSGTQLLACGAASWLAGRLTPAPGADTWAFKTLPGIPADTLTDSQVSFVEGKNGNVYTTLAGVPLTRFGTASSGYFADVTRFVDWLTATLQTSIIGILANNAKIPYTDKGVQVVVSTVKGVLQQGVDAGGLASTPAPIVTAPLVANVSSANKMSRLLPNVSFSGTLAGAIHTVQITGTVSF